MLHHDSDNIINCLISGGEKQWLLLDTSFKKVGLGFKWTEEGWIASDSSPVDPDHVNLLNFPGFQHVSTERLLHIARPSSNSTRHARTHADTLCRRQHFRFCFCCCCCVQGAMGTCYCAAWGLHLFTSAVSAPSPNRFNAICCSIRHVLKGGGVRDNSVKSPPSTSGGFFLTQGHWRGAPTPLEGGGGGVRRIPPVSVRRRRGRITQSVYSRFGSKLPHLY